MNACPGSRHRRRAIRPAATALACVFLLSMAGASIAASPWERVVELAGIPGKVERLAEKGFTPSFGNYFDPANPGWGLDIQSLGELIFAVWFTYNPDGTPTWYIIVGEPSVKGDVVSVTGDIESFKWDPFGVPGAQATASVVGTMTIAWSDPSHADVNWTLDGIDGGAPVTFFQFSNDPALANLTGHYFNFFASGWGFTLLTQGAVTAMTMYWYKDGQPVWAQGVSTALGTSQVIELLHFLGPGLCPSCLPRKGGDGFTTTPLATLQVNWGVALPPQVGLDWLERPGKGGPLGPRPFGDLPLDSLGVTTEAITSAFQDHFDPTYSKLANKGNGQCVPFQYDPGFLAEPPAITGKLLTAYAGLPATTDGRIPVFTDAGCTNPFLFDVFGNPRPSFAIVATTDAQGMGAAFDWSAYDPFKSVVKGEDDDDCDDDGNCEGWGGGAGYSDEDDDEGNKGTPPALRIYGSNPYFYQRVGIVVSRVSGEWDPPPTLEDILAQPGTGAYIVIPLD